MLDVGFLMLDTGCWMLDAGTGLPERNRVYVSLQPACPGDGPTDNNMALNRTIQR